MGVQSLDDETLSSFGRDHNVRDALDTIDLAKTIFDNISLDFIYSRPKQNLEDWTHELRRILELGAQHLSLYNLMIERGTPLYKQVESGDVIIPDEETCAEMYEATIKECHNHGYHQYEVSSFAQKDAFKSRHNQAYWQGIDYIGIGPGAHGRIRLPNGETFRTYRVLDPQSWMKQVTTLGHGIKRETTLSLSEALKV